jgi:hypothetical protein
MPPACLPMTWCWFVGRTLNGHGKHPQVMPATNAAQAQSGKKRHAEWSIGRRGGQEKAKEQENRCPPPPMIPGFQRP